MSMPTDSPPLTRAINGDREALSELLEKHGPYVRRQLEKLIPRRWQSVLSMDDVMQEAYTCAFLCIRSFSPLREDSFEDWLLTITRNQVYNALRMLGADKRGGGLHRVAIEGEAETGKRNDESYIVLYSVITGSVSSPSSHAARIETKTAVERAIEALPATYRAVIRMYDIEGRSIEEVAGVLKRSPGAVYMLRSRALHRLSELLGTPSGYLNVR